MIIGLSKIFTRYSYNYKYHWKIIKPLYQVCVDIIIICKQFELNEDELKTAINESNKTITE